MPDQNIDPIALIEWMWHNVMQVDGNKWISWDSATDMRASAEVLEQKC